MENPAAVDDLTIQAEHFDHPDAVALREELAADLHSRYGRDTEPGAKPTASDTAVFLVVRAGDEPLGCGALRALDTHTVEIKRMFVRPSARGRGLGRRILAALEEEAARMGATRVVLETGVEQHEAIALYERAGYRSIPCFGAYVGSPISLCYERVLGTD
jgi:GNAT superfamily N-acetyltransferase